jgi:hypothetical protein
VLKGGVKLCQRQLVNEMLGPLVTEFARNLGREAATLIQRGFNASPFGRVQALKLMRHNALRYLMARGFRLVWCAPTRTGLRETQRPPEPGVLSEGWGWDSR